MKREPPPTLEQLAEVVRHVDLDRLKNRLIGKQLLELEHCLVEVLGQLTDDFRATRECTDDIARYAMEATDGGNFLSAYNDYMRERGSLAKNYANFSPTGRYFQSLLDRLNNVEDKQARENKPVTVTHARMLAALIVRQLAIMTNYSLGRNEKLDKLWEHWTTSRRPA
ncbi:MAG: hypothetical protein BGO63_10475 [Candidatus Accumulibacter sp. 66-26]|nr:hypothetical protein [Accumulibacter sp.]OJW51548.1 MAG: hypothetical protein BGO63_10475 [Candidatus Accumulibacter sp. 66-26]